MDRDRIILEDDGKLWALVHVEHVMPDGDREMSWMVVGRCRHDWDLTPNGVDAMKASGLDPDSKHVRAILDRLADEWRDAVAGGEPGCDVDSAWVARF
jgi:hypothetical protein